MMRALLLDRLGSPADLRVGVIGEPEPAEHDVLVRVEACGLNPVDAKLLSRGRPEWSWPHVPGVDFAGIVESVGPAVAGVRVGDRVAGHGALERKGALAELIAADARTVALVPAGVDPATAAALPCAGMTAYQSVFDRLHVLADHTVLVTAGSGAVGGFAVQLAAATGARVISTASPGERDRVRALGASEVIDHRTEDVASRIMQLTAGRGVDRIVDVLPSPSATRLLRLLAHGGGIACVGDRARLSEIEPFTIAPSVHEIALGAAHASGDDRALRRLSRMLAKLLAMVNHGRLDPLLREVVPLSEAAAALERVRSGSVHGKAVVVLEDAHQS